MTSWSGRRTNPKADLDSLKTEQLARLLSANLRCTLDRHERWRREQCLNLIASENVTSAAVRRILGSNLGDRYTAPDHFYLGCKFTDQIEDTARRLVCEVFSSEWADVRPISGHIADMALLSAFAQRGDKIMAIDRVRRYPGTSEVGYPRILGLVNLHFPFDKDRWNIQIEKTIELITNAAPKLVILGASYLLFPHPVQELAKVCRESDAKLAYDGSHVMGLIAGGAFQQPLKEGTRVLVGSTHKSLFGPQGGIMVAFNSEGERLEETIFSAINDNAH